MDGEDLQLQRVLLQNFTAGLVAQLVFIMLVLIHNHHASTIKHSSDAKPNCDPQSIVLPPSTTNFAFRPPAER